jgi:hypothetical protein
MIYRAIALSVMTLASLAALALTPDMEQEIEAIRAYCKPDIERLCTGVEPGEGRIKKCLKAHEKEISVGCAQALQKLKNM